MRPLSRILVALALLAATLTGLSGTFSNFSTSVSNSGSLTSVALFAPSNATLPSISGTLGIGLTLTADHGTWNNNDNTISYGYQWQRCSGGTCSNISAATAVTYVPTVSDVGSSLQVVVTATNGGGSGSATSNATSVL
jgi:hypothetical protein